jgi:glycine/D-amino acid oxidase-like deaminating enzyme
MIFLWAVRSSLSTRGEGQGEVYLCLMHVDVLIMGQGICGTMLSWFLNKEGKSFLIIDDNNEDAPSKVAAGIINPVTGRRFVYSWMIDTVMPFAAETYKEIGIFFREKLIIQKDIIDFFPSPQMLDAFATRLTENDTYLHSYPDQNHFNQFFNHDFGCGQISPAYIANVSGLITKWREHLKVKKQLLEESFTGDNLVIEKDFVRYNTITAKKIVFCNGINAANLSWFNNLPFSPSKGEMLLIESEDLTNEHIFKKGMMLAPLFQQNLFWAGSSYQWEYEHANPTKEFYDRTKILLDQWLKVPYKIIEHKAALRPSTLERRPFVGFHPQYNSIGILNGMGTKGTSLAPFFANQLVQNILLDAPITKEADVKRFTRILSK